MVTGLSVRRKIFPDTLSNALVTTGLLVAMVVSPGCSPGENAQRALRKGMNRQEVRNVLGEPSEIREFRMPQEPFFGPQEILVGRVPLGSPVEEWRYEQGSDVLYVWLHGQSLSAREEWRVVAFSKAPKDAVY